MHRQISPKTAFFRSCRSFVAILLPRFQDKAFKIDYQTVIQTN
nr:MAG TPA: hypothetical protein [Caudoviricetes sp.]